MKILSFFGMILSLALIMILILLYFSAREYFGHKETVIIFIGLFIGLYLLVFSLIVAKNYIWGDKNSFVPPTGY